MCRTISLSADVKPLAVQRAIGFADLLMRLRTCSTLLAQTRSYPLPLSTSQRRTWLVATGAARVGTGQVASVMLLRAGRFNLTSFVVVRAAARRSKMFGLACCQSGGTRRSCVRWSGARPLVSASSGCGLWLHPWVGRRRRVGCTRSTVPLGPTQQASHVAWSCPSGRGCRHRWIAPSRSEEIGRAHV